ncbi:MAG TPA: tetratricopeptide repeat protein [Candidatus Acidoferrum sp.]|nr:tetratricopeptide repeat protein [Candidatus Acidoferrum sp.]
MQAKLQYRLIPSLFLLLAGCPLAAAQIDSAKLNAAAAQQFQQATEAMRAGDLSRAGDGFESVVKSSPQFAEAYLNLGLVREEQRRHSDAIANFKKALQLKPRLRGANLFLGVAEFRSNQLDAAILALKKEVAASPKDANAWMWLGVVQLEKGDGPSAAAALDKAAELAPDNVDILYHRGRAHLLISNQSYAKMFEADPKSWRVRQLLAEANASAERHLDAIAEYELAIKLAPNQPRLHEDLGTQYRLAGKLPEAEQAYLKEIEIDPDNVTAGYKLGVIAIEKGDAARGKELIEGALRARPNLQHSDYNLGRAEMLLGNDAAATRHFERAVSADVAAASDPDVVEQSWYQLGIAYRRLRRMDEAQKAMATFQRLKDEDAESSAKALKRFQVQQDATSAQPSPVPQSP